MTQLLRLFVFAAIVCLPALAMADTIVYVHADSARLIDDDADDLGDIVGGVASGAVAIGETNNASADQQEGRFWLPFALSAAQRSEILNASSVLLSVYLESKQNVAGFNIALLGIASRTGTTPVLSDYEAAGTTLLAAAIKPVTPLGFVTLDVTAFAQQEAASPGSVLAFRMQIDPPSMPIVNAGIKNNYIVSSLNSGTVNRRPQLIVTAAAVPEPAALGLAVAAAALAGPMRRR